MSTSSDSPPPVKNTNIHVAVITACGAVIAASIPLVSNAISHRSDTPAAAVSAVSTTQSELSSNQLADRSEYYVTLNPYPIVAGATGSADSYTAINGAYFRSPKDAKRWIQLTITQHDHNQIVTLVGTDFRGKTDSDILNANRVKDHGNSAWVDTRNFKVRAEVIEARTVADPDTVAPRDGKVFDKLLLRISCEDHS
jgi:hypothetical protein